MSVKLKCTRCGHVYTASNRYVCCPINWCHTSNSTLLDDVLDVAVGVAVGYATGSLIEDGISAAADVVGSLFDW